MNNKRETIVEICVGSYEDCLTAAEAGADGIAFGFLNPDGTVCEAAVQLMVDLIHSYGKTAVFQRADNAPWIIQQTGVTSVHASCRDYETDTTTIGRGVTFAYLEGEQKACYEKVSPVLARQLVEALEKI